MSGEEAVVPSVEVEEKEVEGVGEEALKETQVEIEMVVVKKEETPEPNPEDPESEQLAEAKSNLLLAKDEHQKATKQVLEDANEYTKVYVPEDEEEEVEVPSKPEDQKLVKLVKTARNAQMQDTNKWYQFWQTATRIPKDSKYETYGSNDKKTWKDIARANEEFLRSVIAQDSEEAGDETPNLQEKITWKKVSNRGGVRITMCPEKTANSKAKAKMYKLETNMNVAPKLVLLTLLRGPVLGKADENLLYFREHYNFVGGRTSLIHYVRKITSNASISIRDFFDLTNWSEDEDGTIYFTASSVKALPDKMPDTVRAANLFKGVCIKPTETGGSDVTFISQVEPKGWVWSMVLDWLVPANLTAQVKAMEGAGKTVQEEGNEEKFLRKFVLRELNVE